MFPGIPRDSGNTWCTTGDTSTSIYPFPNVTIVFFSAIIVHSSLYLCLLEMADWERLIDWMAMAGPPCLLLLPDKNPFWYKVADRTLRFERQNRFARTLGPAHLPWHRMAQCRLLAKSTTSILELKGSREELQKRMLERERRVWRSWLLALPACCRSCTSRIKTVRIEMQKSVLRWRSGGAASMKNTRIVCSDPMDSYSMA